MIGGGCSRVGGTEIEGVGGIGTLSIDTPCHGESIYLSGRPPKALR